MDIPRTYLQEIAVAALAKVSVIEPHMVNPLDVEQAIVDLQGVMTLVQRNATELITTDFERACQEALTRTPLDEWLIKWRQAQKAEQDAAKAARDNAEAEAEALRADLVARAEARAAEAEAAVAAEETPTPVAPKAARRPRKAKAASAEAPPAPLPPVEEQPPPASEA